MCWNTRTFSATAGMNISNCNYYFFQNQKIILAQCCLSQFYVNGLIFIITGGGAFCNGQKIHASQIDKVSA